MRERLGRILVLVRKEFLQLFRDRRMAPILFVAPMVQLIVFGYAVSTEVRGVPLAVVDEDGTRASRELTDALMAGGWFRSAGDLAGPAELVRVLEHGDAIGGLVIPRGFERDLDAGRARVQLLFDGTDSNTATIAKGYAEKIVATRAVALAGGGLAPPVELRLRAWFNPGLDSRHYNVPAVIGAILLLICNLLTALAVVREREIGTLDQLAVSPLEPLELVIGKTVPFALIGLFDLALISTVAIAWFGVPFRGSVLLLVGASMLFILCALGIGLLVSTISSTQQEAYLAAFLTFMPVMLLSGFMFPISSMSPIFRWLTLANPLRHYLQVVRGVFLQGVSAADVLPQLGAMALIAALLLGASVRRFARAG